MIDHVDDWRQDAFVTRSGADLSLPTRSSPGTPARGTSSVAISTTVDQVLSSASNALMVFVVAQVSSAEEFGIIALLITAVAVCTGFNRGALGTPLLLTGNLKNRQIVAESDYAVTWSLYSGVLGGVLILTVGAVFHHPWIGLAFAVGLPVVLAQDVLRLTAITLVRPDLAVVADALWVASMLGIFVANLFGVRESAEFSIYLWGLSGLVSAAILAIRLKVAPHHSRIFDWWRTCSTARVHFGSVYFASQIGILFVTLAAVTTAGSVAAAGIRGGFTLFGPIMPLLAAMPMVFLPHAARTGKSLGDQWRLVRRTSLAASVLTLVAGGCLMAVPTRLGTAMLGESWQETFSLIPYIGVTFATMWWLTGAFTFFASQGASRTVFWLAALHVGLQVATCFATGLVFGSAIAIAISLAFCGSAIAVVGVLWVHRSIRASAKPSRARPESAVLASGAVASQ